MSCVSAGRPRNSRTVAVSSSIFTPTEDSLLTPSMNTSKVYGELDTHSPYTPSSHSKACRP